MIRRVIAPRRLAKAIVRLALLACGAGAPLAQAEPLYVIEQLVVSVNSAPAGSGERIASIRSGDKVEALEHSGDEIHVQLSNGKDGWVKASYLSPDEPLQKRLGERTAEVEKLKQDVSRLQAELTAAKAGHPGSGTVAGTGGPQGTTATAPDGGSGAASAPRMGSARSDVAGTASGGGTAAPGTNSGTVVDPDRSVGGGRGSGAAAPAAGNEASLFQVQAADPPPVEAVEAHPHAPWGWVAGSSSLSLALGFLLGWRMLDRRIRSKYGGLRIY